VRYAEKQYSEEPVAIGIFETGDTVSITVIDSETDALVGLDSASCTPSAHQSNLFFWSFSNISDPPGLSGFHQLVYIMENVAGRQHMGKIVVGGYPSDSAVRRFGGYVHIDTNASTTGTDFPLGTETDPVDNITDARTIADRENLTKYLVRGSINVSTDHEGWSFEGVDPLDDIVTVSGGASVDGSQFKQVTVLGALDGRITAQDSLFGNGVASVVTGVQGLLENCGVNGRVVVEPGGVLQGAVLYSQQLLSPGSIIDLASGGGIMVFLGGQMSGNFTIRNASAAHIIGIAYNGGTLHLESSVASTNVELYGNGELVNNATGVVSDNMIRGSRIDAATSTRATPAQVTSSVWGISELALATAGPSGLLMALGMSQNTQIDFTGDDLLGWQLIINDTAGSEIGRADLYDEANARIPSSMSVAAFIGAQKTISRVVPS
jgi:hypothetical protein